MPKLCSNYVQMMFKCKRDFTCRALKWTFSRVTGHMTHQRWVQHISLVLVWTVTFPLKNEAASHIEFILPYFVLSLNETQKNYTWCMVSLSRDMYLTRKYQKLSSLTIQFFVKVSLLSLAQEACVRIGIKGSWRLWFRKWVLPASNFQNEWIFFQ